MYCLGDQDRGRNPEVILACDKPSTTKVCRGPDPFENRGEGNEARDIGVREFVFACSDWRSTSSGQSRSEELDVFFLIVNDIFKVAVILRIKSRGDEILFRHFFKSSLVEDIFKMLELVNSSESVSSSPKTKRALKEN